MNGQLDNSKTPTPQTESFGLGTHLDPEEDRNEMDSGDWDWRDDPDESENG